MIVEIPGCAFFKLVDWFCGVLYLISKYLYIKLVVIVFVKEEIFVEKFYFSSKFKDISVPQPSG